MSLILVATPIGNPEDLSLRALRELREADIIVGEERKVAAAFLRAFDVKGKVLELLNEHSTPEEIQELAVLCQSKRVALISDCGTPGFCDPGAHLIRACRRLSIPVDSIPGASSLMLILSLSSARIDEFLFRGFLPAENQARERAWKELTREHRAIVLMDTPYRLRKFMAELAQNFPHRRILLAINLTGFEQEIIEAKGLDIAQMVKSRKAPFIALVYSKPVLEAKDTSILLKSKLRPGKNLRIRNKRHKT